MPQILSAAAINACGLKPCSSVFFLSRRRYTVGLILTLLCTARRTHQVFTSNFSILICGFCAFEAAIGAYWPLVMKLRSDNLGEDQRAAVTSLFRVPLNVVVCLVLIRAGWLSLAQEFALCVGFLIVALTCQRVVVRGPRGIASVLFLFA